MKKNIFTLALAVFLIFAMVVPCLPVEAIAAEGETTPTIEYVSGATLVDDAAVAAWLATGVLADDNTYTYTIKTREHLACFMRCGEGNSDTAPNPFRTNSGKFTVKLANDITWNDFTIENGEIVPADGTTTIYTWIPYGNTSSQNKWYNFRGVFDGNGHTISGLYLNGGKGFFAMTGEGAVIQDVSFENMYIKGNMQTGALVDSAKGSLTVTRVNMDCVINNDAAYVSALVKQPAADTTIENCFVKCDINNGASAGLNFGALVSYPANAQMTVNISNCVVMGDISTTAGTGAVGSIFGAVRASNIVNITNCVSYAKSPNALIGDATAATTAPTIEASATLVADDSWYNDGAGVNGAFIISTPAQLAYFMLLGQSGETFRGKTVKLGADIYWNKGTIDETGFNPAAEQNGVIYRWVPYKSFAGVLDGNGKTIYGIYVNGENASEAGFILETQSGVAVKIKNIDFVNTYITGGATTQIGALVGVNSGSLTISNVNMGCVIDSTSSYVSGLVKQPKYNLTVENVTVACDINGVSNIGGFVAFPVQYQRNVNLTNCIVKGKIVATGGNVGGFIGNGRNCNVTMTNCVNYADISGSSNVAGLIGALTKATISGKTYTGNANITTCASFGRVTATGTDNPVFRTGSYVVNGTSYTAENLYTAEFIDVKNATSKNDGLKFVGVQQKTPVDNTVEARFVASLTFNDVLQNISEGDTGRITSNVTAVGFELATLKAFAAGAKGNLNCNTLYTGLRYTDAKGNPVKVSAKTDYSADYFALGYVEGIPSDSNQTVLARAYCVVGEGETAITYYTDYTVWTLSGGKVLNAITVPTAVATEPKPIETKTYKINEILESVKTLGRTTTQSTGLVCDHVASGIEFNAYIEGKVTLGLKVSKSTLQDAAESNCYFTLYIDGVRQEQRLKADASTKTLELANFTVGGVHNIRLVKQTEPRNGLCELTTLNFTGYFEEKPAEKEYYIEFLGDSITCGYGNLITGGTAAVAQTAINQDATRAFAYLTAEKLGVDHAVVSTSGIGAVRGYRTFVMKDLFGAQSFVRSKTETYEPQRTPDLVVINLGTNDEFKSVSLEDWQTGVNALIRQVRTTYGENVPIVWCYGMMSNRTDYPVYTQNALNAFGGESGGVYLCKLAYNTQGGGDHPNLEGHETASKQLVKFIQDKGILK